MENAGLTEKNSFIRDNCVKEVFLMKACTSCRNLEQEDINLVMNHINSYRRAKLNHRTPMEAFAFMHGTEALKLLGCKLIEPNCVMLTPKLLKR